MENEGCISVTITATQFITMPYIRTYIHVSELSCKHTPQSIPNSACIGIENKKK
jgi:hypothetical protein